MKKKDYIYKRVSCDCREECHPPCDGTMMVRDKEAELRRENRRLRKIIAAQTPVQADTEKDLLDIKPKDRFLSF